MPQAQSQDRREVNAPVNAFKNALESSGLSTRRKSEDGYKLIGFTFRAGDKKWMVEHVDTGKRYYATTKFVRERFFKDTMH